ncbi:MAG TPA: helix-turn-helix domain-containing protein [Solirubrobacterales bacterium]|nr:helix-turn-helix domain-containing protein [Solirubrobacterales bacterium]
MGSEEGGKRRDKESHYRCATLLHPLRERILRLTRSDEEVGLSDIAAELDEAPGRVAYHLRVLIRRNALKVVPKCRPAPPLYRWSPAAEWARKMLDEIDELGSEGG